MASLSRRLADFLGELTFEDLPPQVVDKVKAHTLHKLSTALCGYALPENRKLADMIKREETPKRGGATILVDGSKATRMGAAFANANIMRGFGQTDSYKLVAHPGSTVMPAAFAMAETEQRSGKDFIVAVAAGYEIIERLAGDFLPSTQARGFRAGPVYGIFGAAVAAGRLLRLDRDQMNSAIALSVNMAAGNLQGRYSGGGGEGTAHEPAATRNGILAALLARDGIKGGETTLEGEAGFYHSYAGSNKGKLIDAFTGRRYADIQAVAQGLGQRWELMNTVMKIYPTGGPNEPMVDLAAELAIKHKIEPDDIAWGEIEVNWIEALRPSPAFRPPGGLGPHVGSLEYFCAYGIAKHTYPVIRPFTSMGHSRGERQEDPPEVLELMERFIVRLSHTRKPLASKITVHTKDRKTYSIEGTGDEFKWDLKTERERIVALVPGMAISAAQFQELMETVSRLEELDTIDPIINLTLIPTKMSFFTPMLSG